MKKGGVLLLLAVGAGLYWFSSGAQSLAANLRVRFGNLSFNFDETRRSLFSRLYFNITINIVNPTDRDINLNAAAVKLYYNNKPVAIALREAPFTVSRLGNTDVKLLAAVSTLNIFGTIQEAALTVMNKKPLSFQVEGLVTGAGNIRVPIKENVTIQL